MEKLNKILEKAYDYGKLPKGFSPYMVNRLYDIYNALRSGQSAEFIESEIHDLLVKCKIKVKPRGIGWIAYP